MEYQGNPPNQEHSTAMQPVLPDWVQDILGEKGTKWEFDQESGKIIIHGELNISKKELRELPDLSKVIVEGDFYCDNNQLTSLTGAPQSVGGDFYCSRNQLTSLTGAPQSVEGNFCCDNNQLTSLTGAPQSVGGNFYCADNPIIINSEYPKLTQLSITFGGYKNSEILENMQNISDDKKSALNNIIKGIGVAQTLSNIKDFAREVTNHLLLPLYVWDYAKQTNQEITEKLLYKIENKIDAEKITEKLLPIVMNELLLNGNNGKARDIENIMGLSETWHRHSFPDSLRPDKANGSWRSLTKEKIYEVPQDLLPQGSGKITCTILSSDKELKKEGEIMRHCVGDYTNQCLEGKYHVVSIRDERNDIPLSTLGIIIDDSGVAKEGQNLSTGNSYPCKAAKVAANWLVAEINKGEIKNHVEFGKTVESKAKQKVSALQRKIGYLPTPQNIQNVFAEYNNRKRNARNYDIEKGDWNERPSKNHLIGGTYTTKEPFERSIGTKQKTITKTTDTGYRDLSVEKWFEVSGLEAVVRNYPFIPHPSPEELAKSKEKSYSYRSLVYRDGGQNFTPLYRK